MEENEKARATFGECAGFLLCCGVKVNTEAVELRIRLATVF